MEGRVGCEREGGGGRGAKGRRVWSLIVAAWYRYLQRAAPFAVLWEREEFAVRKGVISYMADAMSLSS